MGCKLNPAHKKNKKPQIWLMKNRQLAHIFNIGRTDYNRSFPGNKSSLLGGLFQSLCSLSSLLYQWWTPSYPIGRYLARGSTLGRRGFAHRLIDWLVGGGEML